MNEDKRRTFLLGIINTLKEHPTWTNDALQAVMHGLQYAIADANARTSKFDWAMRAALVLAHTSKISDELKATLNDKIIEALGSPNQSLCEIERKALEKAREAAGGK